MCLTFSRRPLLKLAAGLVAGLGISAAALADSLPQVRLKTSMGDIVVELYPDKAPKTVENFLQYVQGNHYDGTVFHRVIDGFMIQGGGFDAKLNEKPTRAPVKHEGQAALAAGGPRNVVGTLAMARTPAPHSATAQFFINVKDNAFLDPTPIPPGDPVPSFTYRGKEYKNVPRARLLAAGELYGYTVFGKVIEGMDVVNRIKTVPTGAAGPFRSDVPKEPVTIIKAIQEK
ncbi:peptidylprolyl isomerase [Hydrogenophaga sp. 5NK40-0174]|uniref:peptidylprolyl isomerase n=1 Tax=Hydrogenophaga sp. 5NK40-0174 TaxID=3127649 RepID=UPI0031089926